MLRQFSLSCSSSSSSARGGVAVAAAVGGWRMVHTTVAGQRRLWRRLSRGGGAIITTSHTVTSRAYHHHPFYDSTMQAVSPFAAATTTTTTTPSTTNTTLRRTASIPTKVAAVTDAWQPRHTDGLARTTTLPPYAPEASSCLVAIGVAAALWVWMDGGMPQPQPQQPWTTTTAPVFSNSTTAYCEAASASARNVTEDKDEDDEDDPYANLPEQDEETDCSMCKTFRQGPCRDEWRRLERCFKDHTSSSSSNDTDEGGGGAGVHCLRYFTPHQNCLSDYVNLYQLISLDMKQELVNNAEKAVTVHERRWWSSPSDDDENGYEGTPVSVDWSRWKEFYQEVGPSFQQTVLLPQESSESSSTDNKASSSSKRKSGKTTKLGDKSEQLPLWKRLPLATEPVLIATTATLPLQQENMMLKIAYAIDQDGFVLGLGYNQQYMDLLDHIHEPQAQAIVNKDGDKKTNAAKTEKSGSVTTIDNEDDDDETVNGDNNIRNQSSSSSLSSSPSTYELDFYLLPGATKEVQICAMYSENPVTAPADKDILDVLLYKTRRRYNLNRIATEVDDVDPKTITPNKVE